MESVNRWLLVEAKGSNWVQVVFGGVPAILILNILVALFYRTADIETPALLEDSMFSNLPILLLGLFAGVLLEEFLFRWVPLVIALKLFKVRNPYVIGSVVLLSSILFGWAHGTLFNILIQGISGIGLSLVYLKCGGMHNKHTKAFLSSTTTHLSFNFFLVTVAVLAMTMEALIS